MFGRVNSEGFTTRSSLVSLQKYTPTRTWYVVCVYIHIHVRIITHVYIKSRTVCIDMNNSLFLLHFLGVHGHMIPSCTLPLTYPRCTCRGFLAHFCLALSRVCLALSGSCLPLSQLCLAPLFFFFFILANRMQGVGVYEKQSKKKCRLTLSTSTELIRSALRERRQRRWLYTALSKQGCEHLTRVKPAVPF